MAVVGGLLIFIGLAGMGVAAWALFKGGLGWANIANRKVAGGVLAGACVVFMVGGGISPQDDDKVAVQAGTADETTTTTAVRTSTTEPMTTTTIAAPSTDTAHPATTATTRATTTTTKPPTTTTTAKPVTTTTVKPATTSTTATTSPPVTQPPTGQLAFRTMQCDAPGSPDDASNTNDEWVELVNNGAAVDLTGWTVHDEGPNYTYAFSGLTLAPGGAVKVHTGSGTDTSTDLYWGRNQHVWNNTTMDIAYLVNPSGALVTSKNCR